MSYPEEIIREEFDPGIILKIWRKGEIIFDINPDIIRRDLYGDWIKKDDYNNPDSVYGWVIFQLEPESMNGNTTGAELFPVNYRNNM